MPTHVDVTSCVLLKFADDTKVGLVVDSEEQKEALQNTINRLLEWSVEWQMLFNSDKCHILHLGPNNCNHTYRMGDEELLKVEHKKDVGVIVHHSLKLHMQCTRPAARANAVLGQLSRAVTFSDRNTFLKLYKVYVRPHLEYAVASWAPWSVENVEMMEKTNLRGRTYEDKLKEVGMISLSARRTRGDMIASTRL